ncbi:Hypothetical predicted protein [Podarcis lilfordi]|uniref:Uncharacterized protein n=1 Tax=Podarcis lilfordi TaxID=74358 RepID=A0AA35KSR6_9SAUR|nr:Hypothetical predicted protein [Podarcis lilfordi]
MLLQNWRGLAGLPSQPCPSNKHFPHGFADIESLGLPSKVAESSRRSHQPSQPFSAAELKRINMDRALSPKVLFPSKRVVNGASGPLELSSSRGRVEEYSREPLHPKHPQRAKSMSLPHVLRTKGCRIDIPDGAEHNSSTVGRRHYIYRLPNWNTKEDSPTQPLARRQSCSELDLRTSLPEELPRNIEAEETWSVRNLELELNMMHFELLSLKQKMESSFAHIEKEKQWLEMTCSEDRKHKGDLDDNLFSLETELVKARSSLGIRNHGSLSSPGSSQNATVEELVSLQSSLLAHESHIKALEEKQEEMGQKLETAKEEKVALHQGVQHLTLELERARKPQEGSNDQVSALHSELICAKTQVNHQDKEKVLMEEELESTRQACKTLSSEAAESRQRLEASLEKLHRSKAEKKILESRIQALENEQSQMLKEAEGASLSQEDRRKLEEELKELFRQQQAGYKKHPGGPKEDSSVAPLKSQRMLTVAKPIRLPEEGQAELQGVPSTSGEAQSLQQQLREKTEIITSMASEIQALKQKNEALMKAKLRFQQQIQEICRLSKQGPERSRTECLVPQLSANPDQDVQSAHGCNSPVPSPQRNELTSSIGGRENWPADAQDAQLHSGAEEEQSRVSSDTCVAHLSVTSSAAHGNLLSARPLPSPPGSSGPTVPSVMLSLPPTTSHQEGQGHLEGEGTLPSPRSSALLSPRPFGSPRPWSPFKFRGSPEPSED